MFKYAVSAFILSAGAAMAHPGHEAARLEGPMHWLTQADHLAVILLGPLALGLLAHGVRRAWHGSRSLIRGNGS